MYTRKTALAALGSALMLLTTLCWPANANPAAHHDYNGDGYSDIAWQDNSGDVVIWLMQGGTATHQSLGNVNGWRLVGEANFLGLRTSQLLWQNNTSGQLVIWEMCLPDCGSTFNVSIGTVPVPWYVAGTGDFDGDGKADILWRNIETGQVAIWSNIMSDGTVGSEAIVDAPGDGSWEIVGTGDFDGDGKADILWQNNNNALSIWFMNGTQIISNAGFGPANPGWIIVGTGDFNGDGMADILWSGPDYQVGVWLMNGVTPTAQAVVGQAFGPGPLGPKVINTGDYNGDGKSDIAFEDVSGDVFVWFMSGTQITLTATIETVPAIWLMQGKVVEVDFVP